MAGARIDIEITGKDAGATAAFNKANTAAAQLGATAQKTSAVLGGATVAGSNRAAFALQNLGRVAQDAPFGFIGIQNNLNPLLESFGQLRKETGSNVSALKALGKSLIGPAGIGIALSVVSAAILFYQQYLQRSKKTTEEAKETNEDYIKTLNQITQGKVKGAQQAQDELVNLKILYDRTQDVSRSNEQRLKSVDQLQEKYPAYFKNIKDEAFLARGAALKYNELTNAILASGRARAAADLITENSKRKLTDEQKIIDLQKEQVKNEENLAILRARQASASGSAGVGSAGGVGILRSIEQVESKIADNKTQQRNIATDILKLNENNDQLVKSINTELDKGATLEGNFGKEIDKNTEKLKNFRDEQIKSAQEDVSSRRIVGGLDGIVEQYKKTAEQLNTIPLIPIDRLTQDTTKALAVFDKFTANVNNIISGGLVEGLSGVGEAIGNALATGENVLQAFGASVLSSIGDVLIQFGKVTLAAGVASLALKAALKNPFGPGGLAAIAAGTALIAIGGLVRGFSSKVGEGSDSGSGSGRRAKIPGFANGVNDFMGGLAWVGERGPELVNLPTGSNVIPNHNLGQYIGNDRASVQVSGILRGRDIYLLNKKEQALAHRNGER